MTSSAASNVVPEYMSLKTLAIYAEVTTRTLQNWKMLGMPYIKVRGSVRVRRHDFDNWLSSFTATENTPPANQIDDIWRDVVAEVKNG
ncbi:hypothetical protein SBDP1_340014 [Syntrophobacter sp. SbD1]|nr:hypothetical protein SBDP1_340014 [Syntrophobacter sp. SbD1]